MFTDTHCHIYEEYYKDKQLVIENSLKASVNRIINCGCDSKSNLEVLKSIKEYSNIYGVIGLHPEFADNYNENDIKLIEENINYKKIVAIGEIGLDYHYTKENKDNQMELFNIQLKLAEKYNKPVVIHSREATEDVMNILKKYKVKGVIHSFSGSLEVAKEYIKMGFLLGINGVVTFKNCKLKEILNNIPLENIILETDSPYLTPEPFRGKQNDPSKIYEIASFLTKVYNISLEELSEITNNNIRRVFDI